MASAVLFPVPGRRARRRPTTYFLLALGLELPIVVNQNRPPVCLTVELSHYLLLPLGHRTDLLVTLVVLRPIAYVRVSIGVVASSKGCGSSVCALCPTLTCHPDEDALLLQRTSGIDRLSYPARSDLVRLTWSLRPARSGIAQSLCAEGH